MAPTNQERAPDSHQLALDRTWLAHERTLMAWVRTATSMISFGFTIYKFFQFEGGTRAGQTGIITPRHFALIIISLGVVSLAMATFAHQRQIKQIASLLEVRRRSSAQIVAGLVSIFGLLALVATALRG